MYRTGLPLLAAVLLATAAPAPAAVNPLAAERDRSRPLVVVAPDASDPTYQSLTRALAQPDTAAALGDRQIVVFTIVDGHGERAGRPLDPASSSALLAALDLRVDGPATALLVGKDGGVKLRGHLSVPQILATVDTMPMRRREMRQR